MLLLLSCSLSTKFANFIFSAPRGNTHLIIPVTGHMQAGMVGGTLLAKVEVGFKTFWALKESNHLFKLRQVFLLKIFFSVHLSCWPYRKHLSVIAPTGYFHSVLSTLWFFFSSSTVAQGRMVPAWPRQGGW